MGLWQGLKWYYELCGTRGVCAVASFRLCGRPRELAIVPPQSEYPVYLRIDTSDFCAYRDVLIFRTKSYDPEIPGFSPTTIVDAGAHIGMASILFALKYPSARIIAIEPESLQLCSIDPEIHLPTKTSHPYRLPSGGKTGRLLLDHPMLTLREPFE